MMHSGVLFLSPTILHSRLDMKGLNIALGANK